MSGRAGAFDCFVPLRACSTLGELTVPMRLTAETATTSGGVPFQVREVLVEGNISVIHSPAVRVRSSQSQGLSELPKVQRIPNGKPESALETVSTGFGGGALPSQEAGGTSAGCWYTCRSRNSAKALFRMRLFMCQ